MDVPLANEMLAFEGWRFDPRARCLLRHESGGTWTPVPIGARALDILAVFLENPAAIVSKDMIMDAVWPSSVVEPNNLTVQIATLRRILDDPETRRSCIQTVTGRGYRFVAPVTRVAAPTQERDTAVADVGAASSDGGVMAFTPKPHRGISTMAVGIIGLATILAAGGGWMSRTIAIPPPAAYSGQDRRESVLVLPFDNSSGEPSQNGIAASITHDVTDLEAGSHATAFAPAGTSVTSRGSSPDLRAIGREYDVHFVLTGDVADKDGRLIVSATLYEVAGSRVVWSQHYEAADGLDARRSIAQRIYESTWQAKVDVEAARALRERPDHLDKRDLLLASLATPLQAPTKANFLARNALIDRALALDPDSIPVLERQARNRALAMLYGYSSDPSADLAIAAKAADRMLALDPNALLTLRAQSFVLRAQGKWDEAAAVLHRVIEMQPREGNRRTELGIVLLVQGHPREALESFRIARHLAGGSDPVYLIDAYIALASFANGALAEAIAQARLAIAEFPPDSGRAGEFPWLALIAAESARGEDAEARGSVRAFLDTPRTLRTVAAVRNVPWLAANLMLLDGLRSAGMPEQ